MRRGSIEIIRDILALGRCSTNEAIYRVGLNPPQFGRYRTLLLQGEFIRPLPPVNGRRFKAYEPTSRGAELRRRIERVLEFLPEIHSAIAGSSDGGRPGRATGPQPTSTEPSMAPSDGKEPSGMPQEATAVGERR